MADQNGVTPREMADLQARVRSIEIEMKRHDQKDREDQDKEHDHRITVYKKLDAINEKLSRIPVHEAVLDAHDKAIQDFRQDRRTMLRTVIGTLIAALLSVIGSVVNYFWSRLP